MSCPISVFRIVPSRLAITLRVALASLALVLLTGCWSSSDPEPEQEAKELKTDKDALSTEVPEAELTRLSKKLYQVGMYSIARDSLASLKDRYPLGAYAGFAELKYADSYFFNREYDQAAKLYEDYVKNYPASPEVAYSKLQSARSHVLSAKTDGRDRQPWERSLSMYDDIISGFSGTAYADLAKQERNDVVRELSAYDREIIRFYKQAENSAAVEDRERRFNERWGARLSEIEQSSTPQSAPMFKTLRELAPVTLPTLQVEPPNADTSGIRPSTLDKVAPPAPLAEGRIAVQRVHCSNAGAAFATIEVTQIPATLTAYESTPLSLAPENGVIVVKGTGLAARQPAFDCFGSKDLEIANNGDLRINSGHQVSLSILQDPPRLLIARQD